MSDATPPPPPAPPPAVVYRTFKRPVAKPPPVATAANAPPGAFLVELLVYNGAPFMDHWAYFVRSHGHPDIGVLIQASGDVMNGFSFDIERSHDLRIAGNYPTTRTPLQWVGESILETRSRCSTVACTGSITHLFVCLRPSCTRSKCPGNH